MSVPLDKLYDFINGLCNQDILIYRWYPHGSKKLEDFCQLKKYFQSRKIPLKNIFFPELVCHDQEPLEFSLFSPATLESFFKNIAQYYEMNEVVIKNKKDKGIKALTNPLSIYDNILLLHSEKNSSEVKKFEQNNVISVYYWSHALIARDWFRYAEYDLNFTTDNANTDFLIYNRAWSGVREYRLKFAELLVQQNLTNSCKMGFSVTDQDTDYRAHQFKNNDFEISTDNLEDYFFKNNTSPNASADYNAEDYNSCNIEVVLETLFDDGRNHLTEKILRPIACGKPFILASTPNSLKYLRDYGFKTFNTLWDESYDSITNSKDRLAAIVSLMSWFAGKSPDEKENILNEAKKICKYNKEYFFSDVFFNQIINELKTNLRQGINAVITGPIGNNLRGAMHTLKKENLLESYIERNELDAFNELLNSLALRPTSSSD